MCALIKHKVNTMIKKYHTTAIEYPLCGKYGIQKLSAYSDGYIGDLNPEDIVEESKNCDSDFFLVARVCYPTEFTVFITRQCQSHDVCDDAFMDIGCRICDWPFDPYFNGTNREIIMTMNCCINGVIYDMTQWIREIQGIRETFGGSTLTMKLFAQLWADTQNDDVLFDDVFFKTLKFKTKTIYGSVYTEHHKTLSDLDDQLRQLQTIDEGPNEMDQPD